MTSSSSVDDMKQKMRWGVGGREGRQTEQGGLGKQLVKKNHQRGGLERRQRDEEDAKRRRWGGARD